MVSEETSLDTFDTVCVVGLGYIGLPTAAFIASKGVQVVGVDVNEGFVESINSAQVPFYEPGFETLLEAVVRDGTLRASSNQVEADAYIVCVPTPFGDEHKVDPRYINAAVDEMAQYLRPGALVVLESTAPPGTTEKMANKIIEHRPDLSLEEGAKNAIYLAHCPERVLPGRIMEEMEKNDRVIGGLTPRGTELAQALYSTFASGELLTTNASTAEMAKLTENSFRDVNIAFANELSVICEKLNIDVWELIELANHHPRVNILQPGPGVGGHCIAVDPWFIVSSAPDEARLIRTARETNDSKPEYVLDKIGREIEGFSECRAPRIAALGIAFKADIDDLRESPSLEIVTRLVERYPDISIDIVEPNIAELPTRLGGFRNAQLQSTEEAVDCADIVLLLVEHRPFKELDQSLLSGKVIFDTKGIWR